MREYTSKPENTSHTLDSNPRAHRQAPISELLQNYKDGTPGYIAQRKVGMEFQTVGGKWNVMKVNVDKENHVTFQSLGHGKRLYEENGYTVETDETDLEYVTKAFNEKTEIDALKECASQAGRKHDAYCQGTGFHLINPDKVTTTEEIPDKAHFRPEHNDWWAIQREGQKTAHPQATVGLKLNSIHDFISAILNQWVNLGTTKKPDLQHLLETPKKTGADNREARRTIKSVQDIVKNRREFGPMQKSFVSIVLQYLKMTEVFRSKNPEEPPGLVNAKNAMAFMSRTSLDQIFQQLKPAARAAVITYFKNLPEYKNGKAYIAYKLGKDEEKVLFKDWVNHLETENKDLLINKFHRVSEITGPTLEGDHIPSLSRATDIGYDSDGHIEHGALIELRALTHNVPTNKWGPIAEKVARLVKETNTSH